MNDDFLCVGRAIGHTCGVKVQKVQRVRPAFGRLVQRVVDCPTGNEFYNAAFGGHVHIEYHNHSYPRTSLRHFVALFP